MKTLHQINFWALAINIALFIVPYFGMAFMMVLGAVQLILALAIVFAIIATWTRKIADL